MAEVAKVKRYESGMIVDPITLQPDQKISEALEIMRLNLVLSLFTSVEAARKAFKGAA